nr:2-hydroxyisoflavanone dehydratase-like [Setaria viridis]
MISWIQQQHVHLNELILTRHRTRRAASSPRRTTGVGKKFDALNPSGVLGTSTRLPLLVYFHGGAFLVHSAFSGAHFRFLNALVSAAPAVAVSVEFRFRLAPKHPLPAAYDDAWAALRGPWRAAPPQARRPRRLFVAGDSTGGNIAHNVAMRAGRSGGLPGGARIEGMVLLHPYFRGKELVPSERAESRSLERAERWWAFVCAGRYGIDHPFVNPLAMAAVEWAALGCRRALVTVAELDKMRDCGRRYVDALRASAWAGDEAALCEDQGERHVFFLRKSNGSDKAKKDMIAAVASFMAS